MPDAHVIATWLSIISTVIALGTLVYSWISRPSAANSKAIEEHKTEVATTLGRTEDRLNRHDQRIQKLESEVEHMPGKDLVHQMQMTMEKMSGDLRVMAEQTKATSQSTKRLEEWALKQSGVTK